MLKIDIFSNKGVKTGTVSLPKKFEAEVNLPLLAQALRVYFDRAHIGLAQAKTRAAVNRTKKKWYKQKGTGGARHGAKSAPIFVGGGVAHGPKLDRRELSLPEKMRQKALAVAMTLKSKSGEIVAIDGLASLKKTQEANDLIEKIGNKRFTFVLADENLAATRVLRNLDGCEIARFKDLNAYQVFYGGKIVMDKEIFDDKGDKKKEISDKKKISKK